MQRKEPIPIVDLFAGPGGLGEGFSAYADGKAFRTLVSAEMDPAAHQTLRLRAFFRILKRQGNSALAPYYRFCNGESEQPWDEGSLSAWKEAGEEARLITLGTPEGNRELDRVLSEARLGSENPWILIGGPPCQAYSVVGRSRNRGNAGYKAENDHRHFLYREYLHIIQKYQPAIFVMENVKGILSSKIDDQKIFHTILRDLSDPDVAFGKSSKGGYKIYSMTSNFVFDRNMLPEEVDANEFVVRAEDYGIPQARHRVILLGVREGLRGRPKALAKEAEVSLKNALTGIPPLRSRISRQQDGDELWSEMIKTHAFELMLEAYGHQGLELLAVELGRIYEKISIKLKSGALRLSRGSHREPEGELGRWYRDENLTVLLNQETRSHMSSDLRRYLYASAFAKVFKRSPKGHEEFNLSGLKPAHKNWKSGKFSDRFRVQMDGRPSTTITSHISKDGHYFIHPDPIQCRSLTVREAARLQTFPDNYFFQGNRTQQYHQVGNAVPPLLAFKIAKIVARLCV